MATALLREGLLVDEVLPYLPFVEACRTLAVSRSWCAAVAAAVAVGPFGSTVGGAAFVTGSRDDLHTRRDRYFVIREYEHIRNAFLVGDVDCALRELRRLPWSRPLMVSGTGEPRAVRMLTDIFSTMNSVVELSSVAADSGKKMHHVVRPTTVAFFNAVKNRDPSLDSHCRILTCGWGSVSDAKRLAVRGSLEYASMWLAALGRVLPALRDAGLLDPRAPFIFHVAAACAHGMNWDCVRRIIEYLQTDFRADINAVDPESGLTALHVACGALPKQRSPLTPLIAILLDRGARWAVPTSTPLVTPGNGEWPAGTTALEVLRRRRASVESLATYVKISEIDSIMAAASVPTTFPSSSTRW